MLTSFLIMPNDPVLHTPTTLVEEDAFGSGLEAFCAEIFEDMILQGGMGMAAPQIGRPKSLFVMYEADHHAPRYVINPEILWRSDTTAREMEGCLSYPDLIIPVERPTDVRVRYRTPLGKSEERELGGIDARCFQHEYDHLQGICFVDGLSQLKLQLAKKRGTKSNRRR